LLINLAGICFDSSRFSATVINMPGRKAEYDSLAFAVICVIFISLIFWIVSLSTDIALVLSPQAVNSCLGGLGKARKGLMAHAQKSFKKAKVSGSSGKRLSAKSSSEGNEMDDPNAVKTEINQYALMRGDKMSAKGNTSDAYFLNLKKQHEDDVMLIQELRSQLDARNNVSVSRSVNRPQASNKKSFTPVDVGKSDNTLVTATGEHFEADFPFKTSQTPEESSLQYDEKRSKMELFKEKMKAKASSKALGGTEKDEGF
jgi:hypothetical protein